MVYFITVFYSITILYNCMKNHVESDSKFCRNNSRKLWDLNLNFTSIQNTLALQGLKNCTRKGNVIFISPCCSKASKFRPSRLTHHEEPICQEESTKRSITVSRRIHWKATVSYNTLQTCQNVLLH